MALKRRGFLASAGAVGAATLIHPTSVLAQVPGAHTTNVLRKAEFEGRLGQWFLAHSDDGVEQCDLTIIRVDDAGSGAELEQFVLLLRSRPGAAAMPAGLYNIAGEPFSLYIKPSFELWTVQLYIAEFSLLT